MIEWVSIGWAGCEQMAAAAVQVGVKIFIAFDVAINRVVYTTLLHNN